jgi:large conductance mechanosensitive channel
MSAKDKGKGLLNEFKEFISRGNVIDLAVGMVVGAAFTAIVSSLVDDIVMPLLGLIIGGINFTDLKWVITPASGDVAEVALYYGNFIQAVINFLAISLVVFLAVKVINTMQDKLKKQATEEAAEEAKDETPTPEIQLLTEIRDALVDREA